jgi:hypothetical protein
MRERLSACVAFALIACGGAETEPEGPALKPMVSQARSEDSTRENRAPVVSSLALSTRLVTAGAPIEARFEASDPDGDPLSFEITWLRNGRIEQSGGARSWTPYVLEKGDRVEVRVVASDGALESARATTSARAGNRAPELAAVRVLPAEAPKRGDTLKVTPIASDPDGDDLEFSYEWLVNDELVRGARDASFALEEVQRGDRLRARVRVSDGTSEAGPLESAELLVANAAPVFEKFAGFETSGGEFRHQFIAKDPDGDKKLRFVLAEGPRGMELDPLLGVATWRPDGTVTGKIPVQVEVQDPFGASSALRFELTIAAPASAQPPAQGATD